jgi:glycosyltransferase involved in cell wall biosynthesis
MVTLSIIIPIYNVEKYLDQCLQSIVGVNDIEIILVNDYSPDNSTTIAEEYVSQHSNITLIHHDINRGLGAARNTGIDHATGKYIMFLDSDDYLEKSILSDFVIQLASFNYDQILVSFLRFDDKKGIWPPQYEDFYQKYDMKILTKKNFKEQLNIINISPIRIIKKSKIDIDKIKFPDGVYEDILWSFWFAYSCSNTLVMNNRIYYYRQREESILGKKSEYHTQLLTQYQRTFKLFKDRNVPNFIIKSLETHFIKHLKYVLFKTDRLLPENKEEFCLEIIQQLESQISTQIVHLNTLNTAIEKLINIKFIYNPIKKLKAYKNMLTTYYTLRKK